MTHPYTALIDRVAERAESDLTAFRSRAVTVLTTSSGIVTLMTGLVAFAAARANSSSVPVAAIWIIGVSVAFFVGASVLALIANSPGEIDSPSRDELALLTMKKRWDEGDPEDPVTQECEVAEVTACYAASVRQLAEDTSRYLRIAIGMQIGGVAAAGLAAVIILSYVK